MDWFDKGLLAALGAVVILGLVNLVRALCRGNRGWAARCAHSSLAVALFFLSLWLPYRAGGAHHGGPDGRFLCAGLAILYAPELLQWLRRRGHRDPSA